MLEVGATGIEEGEEEENSYVLTMCGYAIASYIVCSITVITAPQAKRTAEKTEFSMHAANKSQFGYQASYATCFAVSDYGGGINRPYSVYECISSSQRIRLSTFPQITVTK
jgi:hypothetical protein